MKRLHLLVFVFLFFLTASVTMAQDNTLYSEPYRPQYHYSPPCGWMNDPNGMVYYEGEYHLFYQFNPKDIFPGPMHWGHAVSPDLMHWENLPIALYPDEIGPIWSGTVVVDDRNTSGLVPGGGLVAIYSYQNQSQGVAASMDRGRTWVKYDGNPVIDALEKDFRDPKVFWHEATNQWVMIIAVGQKAQFFTSPNLLDWELISSFAEGHLAGVWEVPDIFPMEINGQTKWVLLMSVSTLAPASGGGVQYFIGDFDGRTFTNDNPPTTVLWLDYGPDNYAGTTWNNLADRRVYIGWMSNWQYAGSTPTAQWRGAMTLPRVLQLVETADGIRLAQSVVEEAAALRQPLGQWDAQALEGEWVVPDVQGRRLEIIAEFEVGTAERLGMDVQSNGTDRTRIVYNPARSQLLIGRSDTVDGSTIPSFNPAFGAPLSATRLKLHIFVDESSVEVLAQDGLISLSAQTFVNPASDGLRLFAENGSAQLTHLEVYALDEIWAAARTQSLDLCG